MLFYLHVNKTSDDDDDVVCHCLHSQCYDSAGTVQPVLSKYLRNNQNVLA